MIKKKLKILIKKHFFKYKREGEFVNKKKQLKRIFN